MHQSSIIHAKYQVKQLYSVKITLKGAKHSFIKFNQTFIYYYLYEHNSNGDMISEIYSDYGINYTY